MAVLCYTLLWLWLCYAIAPVSRSAECRVHGVRLSVCLSVRIGVVVRRAVCVLDSFDETRRDETR